MSILNPVSLHLSAINRLLQDIQTALDAHAGAANAIATYPRIQNLGQIPRAFKVLETNINAVFASTYTLPAVKPYRESINNVRRSIVAIFVLESIPGIPDPGDSPPVQIAAMPTVVFTTAAETHDFSVYFSGGDTYTITAYPDNKFSWAGTTGILTYDVDDTTGAFEPKIKAVNAYGSAQSSDTATISYS